ncbi:hypothetical protein DV096_07795 [Bradymonadaceae bacterium TMQ3]|uniref:Secreted protein n=1 Tax=Lujinxingia sediminis TaxID=2480984 RepID=A0ABY0CT18_9DELT|nr:hypothetical protein [Lujinxingia sediminis]RDV38700.1 hypothetical protein DV096_07795 [Bradymonadaceae bacterium TMQ3]RVU44747.1 hypothetical protein EA187_09395 [Lujinxingia sediminis]TXC76527.1 hypothetical protein FRC91_07280 [Bradymonadales bacterium TMQ1]
MRRISHTIFRGLLLGALCLAGCEAKPLPEVDRDAIEVRMRTGQQALNEERAALDGAVTEALDEAAEQVQQAIERADDIDESTFTFDE